MGIRLRQGIRDQAGSHLFRKGSITQVKILGLRLGNQYSYREIKLRQEIRLRLGINQGSSRELGKAGNKVLAMEA